MSNKTLMRWTVKKKIIAAFFLVLCLGAASMTTIFLGLGSVKHALEELADVKEPSSAAAYEMEININGIGLAVLSYLDTPDPFYRYRVNKDMSDFEQFHAKYLKLAGHTEARALGETVSYIYDDFKTAARDLMEQRDRQARDLVAMTGNFERINALIDRDLQPIVDRSAPDALAKIEAVIDMEADIAELGLWLTRYQYEPKAEYKQLLVAHDQEFRETLSRFQRLDLTVAERRLSAALEGLFSATHALMQNVINIEDSLRKGRENFIGLRSKIDAVLDDQIQVLAVQELYEPRRKADAIAGSVIVTLKILLVLFVLAAAGAAWLLIRSITRPIETLVEGTAAVARGDLSHRLPVKGADEFAALGLRFNQMVGELEATTVSKRLLEESDAKLRETVGDLRREISERQHAEKEQLRLQASLQRSETMSALGVLTAGVAHEVRNPLFGISSTLDAFEARFGSDSQYQRYFQILRGEVDRLASLMRALLDYGKPPAEEYSPVAIADVMGRALRATAPLAQSLGITFEEQYLAPGATIYADTERLCQVFQNLVENAVHHSPAETSVIVRCEVCSWEDQLWAQCRVIDRGPGFRAEDLPHIFEPFFTRRKGGTGLGLSIVQRIVDEHGGVINAANRPDGGAVMTAWLPLIGRGAGAHDGERINVGNA